MRLPAGAGGLRKGASSRFGVRVEKTRGPQWYRVIDRVEPLGAGR
jgi:hypothetical protein